MIDIKTHQIIDMIESRQEDDVEKWLETYPNFEIISRDSGIVYKLSSDKAHPKAKQISDRFHVLKNLTDYAVDVLKRLLKIYIKISVEELKSQANQENKWELIQQVQ